MIVDRDGYAVIYERKQNRITILLPPTVDTMTNSTIKPVERKAELSAGDLMPILMTAKQVFQCGWVTERDWCRQCRYSAVAVSDLPCCNCSLSDYKAPTSFKGKEPTKEELEK